MKKVMFNNSELSGSFGQESTPIGTILMYGGTRLPFGFLWCNGSAVSRTVYADLFNAIGTAFGSGDGSTTFNLPDYRGRFPQGADGDLGQTKQAGLPNITGEPQANILCHQEGVQTDGALSYIYKGSTIGWGSTNGRYGHFKIDASKNGVDPIYGKSDTVQPPAQTCNFIIKFCKAISPAQEQFIDDSVVSAEKTWSSNKINEISNKEFIGLFDNHSTFPIDLSDYNFILVQLLGNKGSHLMASVEFDVGTQQYISVNGYFTDGGTQYKMSALLILDNTRTKITEIRPYDQSGYTFYYVKLYGYKKV